MIPADKARPPPGGGLSGAGSGPEIPVAGEMPEPEDFDPLWYLQTYPDVRASGLDPRLHYRQRGRAEGRMGAPVRALEFDRMLWQGHAAIARPALRALMQTGMQRGTPRERALAGWALARWSLDRGDPAAARAEIGAFLDAEALAAPVIGHAGPYLLGVEICAGAGDAAGARAFLRAGLRRFGKLADFALAEFLCLGAQGADLAERNEVLAGVWRAEGLVPVEITGRPGPLFDRLAADPGPRGLATGKAGPRVSVIVPVRDGAAVLGTALRGLTGQSWRALEILVVDDGSTDGTQAVARAAAARDPRIRVLELDRPQGAYPARNAGMAAATGDFITVHDADDWSHPQKIERQLRPLLDDPALQASVSHWVRATPDLGLTRWRMEDRWTHRNVSSLMIRAGLRQTLGFWDRVRVNADTEYYYRLIAAFGPQAIREVLPGVPLAFGRTTPGALTRQEATHLRSQLCGVRRDYMAAAHDWHSRAKAPEDLCLPQFPEVRPFRVPPALSLGDPEPPPGPADILAASRLFDPRWYELSHPDVLRAGLDPVRHYLNSGAAENRDPGPGFSSGGYRQAARLGPGVNPLIEYETAGRARGDDPLPVVPGALADRLAAGAPPRLVFAHSSGRTLFGAERSLLDVLGRMADEGAAPVVVLPALHNQGYLTRLRAVTAAVEFVPQIWMHAERRPHPLTVALIRALIRRHGVREIHVNTMVLDAPLAAARAEGVASVVHVRELPAEDAALCRALGADAESLRQHLLDRADRFVVASQTVADWLAAPGRVTIRPNAVDAALFDLPFAPGPALRVAIVSSNIAKKGLADFLAVARIVAPQRPGIRFLIFGPATADLHLMQPFPANVEFRGYAETPAAAMAEADLVMSLSKFAESFGRTVMEAMAAGRPVICYDRGAPPDLVESGAGGLVVPADDAETAAFAVMALDVARGELARMSGTARARARALQEAALRPGD